MKITTLAFLTCASLVCAQATPQATKNEFSMVIEGVSCLIKVYQPSSPLGFDPMVKKDSLPKSQLITSIMLTNSDISSHMSDEDLSKYMGTASIVEEAKKAEFEEFRAGMKKMYALTGPDAEENPWKGMKHVIDQIFIVESETGKFLVYQMSTEGVKEIKGKSFGTRKSVDGKWVIGDGKNSKDQKFKMLFMQLVPKEFEKLRESSSIATLPLEDLLR